MWRFYHRAMDNIYTITLKLGSLKRRKASCGTTACFVCNLKRGRKRAARDLASRDHQGTSRRTAGLERDFAPTKYYDKTLYITQASVGPYIITLALGGSMVIGDCICIGRNQDHIPRIVHIRSDGKRAQLSSGWQMARTAFRSATTI